MGHGIKKIEKRIQYILGNALLQEIENPKLRFVTITRVEVSGDYRYGKIYVSILGEKEKQKKIFTALSKARNFLQRIVSQNLETKRTPQISFFLDESLEKSLKFNKILDQITEEFQESSSSEEKRETPEE